MHINMFLNTCLLKKIFFLKFENKQIKRQKDRQKQFAKIFPRLCVKYFKIFFNANIYFFTCCFIETANIFQKLQKCIFFSAIALNFAGKKLAHAKKENIYKKNMCVEYRCFCCKKYIK